MTAPDAGEPDEGAAERAVSGPLVRGARAHLRSPAQHAVYRAVGSNPDSWWTAAEIAAHSGLDHADIDQALRGFAGAGILDERTNASVGRLYRWHNDLRYVLGGSSPPPEELVDPVCGMPVDPDTGYTARNATGATVHFCSMWCRAAYRARRHRR